MSFLPINMCLRRPTAAGLEAEYEIFRNQGRFPCTRSTADGDRRVRNQCAVRMSIALSRAMNHDVMYAIAARSLGTETTTLIGVAAPAADWMRRPSRM